MIKKIVATIKKIGMLFVSEYEHRLIQRLLESDVSTSISATRLIRYNGLFARTRTVFRITSYILLALTIFACND